jgi:hypothetical protein
MIAVMAIVLVGCGSSATPAPPSTPATPAAQTQASADATPATAVGLSDAQLTTQMQRNVAIFVGADWYPVVLQRSDGADVTVSAGTATIATSLPQADTTTAATICHTLAAALTDDINQPLPITRVVVTSGGQKIVDCQPV